ncbi:MAG: TypeI-B CRISPR-associated helicase/endonuclease Cas3 [Methanobrevibacter sp. CfCl-M3]
MDINDLNYNFSSSSFKINDDDIKIWAHTNELLGDHLSKTKIIFDRIKDQDILINFHEYFSNNDFINLSFKDFEKYIYKMIDFHDIAKISFNFQINKLNNNITSKLKKYELDKYINQIESKHSYISSLLFTSHLFNNGIFNDNNNLILLLLSYIIYGHHTDLKDVIYEEEFVYYGWNEYFDTFCLFSEYISEEKSQRERYQTLQSNLYDFLNKNHDSKISFFYSYIYSLFVTSDVIASSYSYKTIDEVKIKAENWNNRIGKKLKYKMNKKFFELDYNKSCEVISPEELPLNKISNLGNINDLRIEMLKEASLTLEKSLKNEKNKRIFYLNMPTGAGKTNTSMKLVLDILENTMIDRVIYAMPFINIIEQNYDTIKDNFGLNENNNEIRAIYSASETIFSDRDDDNKSEIILKDSFFDYPIICTTFVSLFNPIIKNKKRYKYTFSSLTNSVIVLDEIQSLPLKNWTSLYYLINEISRNYNIYFIIMSATLPNFKTLKLNNDIPFDYENVHLIREPTKYFSHYLFNRTTVKNMIKINMDDEDSMDYFENILKENFEIKYNKGLIVLNTIKTSELIYEEICKLKEKHDFEIDLLNSTITPSEKKRIIHKIIEAMDHDKRYILVSTQSIEAGVDISFNFVIRDFTTLDSIEQIRGRCNRSREINKVFDDETKRGNVYLINIQRNKHSDYKYIYDEEDIDIKIEETKLLLKKNLNYKHEDVLEYYKQVSNNINRLQDDKETNFIFKDRDNITSWNTLKYSELLNKNYGIHILSKLNNTYSFFLTTKIKILINDKKLQKYIEKMNIDEIERIYEKNNFIFTTKEIKYLKSREQKSGIKLIKNNSIDGAELIKHYENSIKCISKDISAKKILTNEFSSILYNFIFQVSGNKSDFEELIEYNDLKKIGYFYVIPENNIGTEEQLYSMKKGFNFNSLKEDDNNII